MKNTLKQKIQQHQDILSYLFFGVCTTLINILTYAFFARALRFNTFFSALFSWITAVLFAYFTNRKWVFNSKAKTKKAICKELISFLICRLLTGVLDIIIMVVFVDYFKLSDLPMKVISNILVIIINYIASKVLIFRQKP